MKHYDVNFTPFVSVIVREADDGSFEVVGADIDWSDSFRNAWRLDGISEVEEVVSDGGRDDSHPAAAEAIEWADSILDGSPFRGSTLDDLLLRAVADKVVEWRKIRGHLAGEPQ